MWSREGGWKGVSPFEENRAGFDGAEIYNLNKSLSKTYALAIKRPNNQHCSPQEIID